MWTHSRTIVTKGWGGGLLGEDLRGRGLVLSPNTRMLRHAGMSSLLEGLKGLLGKEGSGAELVDLAFRKDPVCEPGCS